MNYINKMGIRSGICLPLACEKGLQGFLFLNSLKQNAYHKAQDQMQSVLSVLSFFARSILMNHQLKVQFPKSFEIPPNLPITCSSLFQISKVLESTLDQLEDHHAHEVLISPESSSFLFSSNNFIEMFAWINVILGLPQKAVKLLSKVEKNQIAVFLYGLEDKKFNSSINLILTNIASNYDYTFKWSLEQPPTILTEFDFSNHDGSRLYSV